jgi:hypothetical protein
MKAVAQPWGATPVALVQDDRVTINMLRVYVALASFQGANEKCWPSRDEISTRAGVTVAAVSKALTDLEETGWIERTRRPQKHTTNVYRVLIDVEPRMSEQPEYSSDSNVRAAHTSECMNDSDIPLYENNKNKTTTIAPDGARAIEHEWYHGLKEAFLSKQPSNTFSNWAKEGKGLHRLIALAHTFAEDDCENWLQGLLETFWRLKTAGDRFWVGQPFLPSVLASDGIFTRVHEEMRKSQPSDELMAAIRAAHGDVL